MMIVQNAKDPCTFHMNILNVDPDFWGMITRWVKDTQPPHRVKRNLLYVDQGNQRCFLDTEITFELPRHAMEFKLRFSVV